MQLATVSWKELAGRFFDIAIDPMKQNFQYTEDMFSQWDALLTLHLQFGAVRGTEIELTARGRASVEAFDETFPSGQVDFRVETRVDFRGLAVNVPLNVSEPLSWSETRVKALVPIFEYSKPILRETKNDLGVVLAKEVLFPPAL
jgi:hypothetical protein